MANVSRHSALKSHHLFERRALIGTVTSFRVRIRSWWRGGGGAGGGRREEGDEVYTHISFLQRKLKLLGCTLLGGSSKFILQNF